MRGMTFFLLRVLLEIIILIIVLIFLVYAVNSIAGIAIFEDKKYIGMIKFIENTLISIGTNKRGQNTIVWQDYVTYNPDTYSIYFDFKDTRIYLYKCEIQNGAVIFSKVKDSDLYAKDLGKNSCHPLYISKKVLTPDTIVELVVGTGSEVHKTFVIYDVKEGNVQIPTPNGPKGGFTPNQETTVPSLIINDVWSKLVITKDSKIKDLFSYFLGMEDSVYKGRAIPSSCSMVGKQMDCVVYLKNMLNQGLIVAPKMYVMIRVKNGNKYIIFSVT